MDNFKQPHIIAASPLVYYIDVIPKKLIDIMVEEVMKIEKNDANFEQSGIGGNDTWFDSKIRNSKIHWWYDSHWACSIISHYIGLANRQYWEYDLNILQSIQVSSYGEGCHYSWHSDYGTSKDGNMTRKLSASILITDPSEYEGGDLEFVDYHNNIIQSPKQMGSVIVFDSRVPHRVTPVTKGKRVSLVTWMLGPKLK